MRCLPGRGMRDSDPRSATFSSWELARPGARAEYLDGQLASLAGDGRSAIAARRSACGG